MKQEGSLQTSQDSVLSSMKAINMHLGNLGPNWESPCYIDQEVYVRLFKLLNLGVKDVPNT